MGFDKMRKKSLSENGAMPLRQFKKFIWKEFSNFRALRKLAHVFSLQLGRNCINHHRDRYANYVGIPFLIQSIDQITGILMTLMSMWIISFADYEIWKAILHDVHDI